MRYRYLAFPGGKQKAVTFSYDDGVLQDIRLAAMFDKYGMKGTFNITSSLLKNGEGNGIYLTADQIKEHILDKGHEVAVHTAHHIASALASPTHCISEVYEGRKDLEDTFDIIVRGMAYADSGVKTFANGSSYEIVKNILTYSGIVYSRTAGNDNDSFELPHDLHAWYPTAHHDNPSLFGWIDKFNSLSYDTVRAKLNKPALMYVWGHSYEFDMKNNWERMEQILDRLSGKCDVWYATNIEIVDYMKAYSLLAFNTDETKVYNPTVTTVWFTADFKTYKVEPGETVTIG